MININSENKKIKYGEYIPSFMKIWIQVLDENKVGYQLKTEIRMHRVKRFKRARGYLKCIEFLTPVTPPLVQ